MLRLAIDYFLYFLVFIIIYYISKTFILQYLYSKLSVFCTSPLRSIIRGNAIWIWGRKASHLLEEKLSHTQ